MGVFVMPAASAIVPPVTAMPPLCKIEIKISALISIAFTAAEIKCSLSFGVIALPPNFHSEQTTTAVKPFILPEAHANAESSPVASSYFFLFEMYGLLFILKFIFESLVRTLTFVEDKESRVGYFTMNSAVR